MEVRARKSTENEAFYSTTLCIILPPPSPLATAEEKPSRLVFRGCRRRVRRVTPLRHQRARPRRLRWQDSVRVRGASEDALWYGRLWWRDRGEILQEHLYYLSEVGAAVWVFLPT